MKKAILKLFNCHRECFIKFGKTNDYIRKNLTLLIFVYKCAGHIDFCKILLLYRQKEINLFFI